MAASTTVTIPTNGGGIGYTFPVVDFDFPDDPNGTIAKAHATHGRERRDHCSGRRRPGLRLRSAPNVVIRDGPIYAPVNNRQLNAGSAARDKAIKNEQAGQLSAAELNAIGTLATTTATATATLKVLSVTVDTFGAGYISAPTVTIADPTW